jgi:divalent metal cation (Fe/Co/Zn/Cd) transporter
MVASPGADERAALRVAVRLQWATIAWNAMEVFVTIGLGVVARSLALVAFGLDSLIEIFAGVVVLWHVEGRRDASGNREVRALRLVGWAFLGLAAFLAVTSTIRLVQGTHADSSPVGVAYLAATVLVMLGLAIAKTRVSERLHDNPLGSEARMTLLDALLAFSVLLALVLNSALDWWWADSAAALLVAVLALVEGRENLKESRAAADAARATRPPSAA